MAQTKKWFARGTELVSSTAPTDHVTWAAQGFTEYPTKTEAEKAAAEAQQDGQEPAGDDDKPAGDDKAGGGKPTPQKPAGRPVRDAPQA